MNLRKILLMSGFAIAMGACFAFTSAKSVSGAGFYEDPTTGACEIASINETGCTTVNAGPRCTVHSFVAGDLPAWGGPKEDFHEGCIIPLYKQF